MTAYNLSSFAGAGAQFFDDNGVPLAGGKVYSYVAGTTTPQATYTTNVGNVANTNPIILDAAGRTPNEIWLVVGVQYKFIVKTSTDTLIGTYDNLPAINDPYSINSLLGSVTGTNAIAAAATPTLTAYASGATYSFIAANSNTAAATLSIDGLAAQSITKDGSTALTAGDIKAGKLTWVEYDGTTFQLLNNIVIGGSVVNATLTGNTITGGTITSLSTPLPIASGGTAGITALAAFDNLKQASTDIYTGVVELATSAEATAGTDATRVLTPATLRSSVNVTGTAPIYAPRFWVNFNGTGTIAITGSGNVSSITDGGVGTYTVNLTTALPTSTYAVVGTVGPRSGSFVDVLSVNSTTTNAIAVQTSRTNDAVGGLNDYAIVNVVGIGG
jgi:hypothetical protein